MQKQKKQGENYFPKTNSLADSTTIVNSYKITSFGKNADLRKRNGQKKKRFSPLSTTSLQAAPKQEVVSITYEEIGLFPRSFSRVLDRFLKQVFSDVENLVIQEYRFYRYLFLTTLKCLLILFFVPFLVNFLAKSYVVRPLTEYFWNTKQTEIFLNSYQQKHAFAELKDFEEKLYFESLIYPKSVHQPDIEDHKEHSSLQLMRSPSHRVFLNNNSEDPVRSPDGFIKFFSEKNFISTSRKFFSKEKNFLASKDYNNVSPPLKENYVFSPVRSDLDTTRPLTKNWVGSTSDFVNFYKFPKNIDFKNPIVLENKIINRNTLLTLREQGNIFSIDHSLRPISSILKKEKNEYFFNGKNLSYLNSPEYVQRSDGLSTTNNKKFYVHPLISSPESNIDEKSIIHQLRIYNETQSSGNISYINDNNKSKNQNQEFKIFMNSKSPNDDTSNTPRDFDFIQKPDGLHPNAPTAKSSFLVYQTIEADKNIQQRYQEKTIELAQRYNDQSVEAITNFFGDIVSLVTLFYLLYVLEIQINITQSFLLEVFFGLDDSKKSLLILLVTDLLVGYHSSNLWELFFELFFNHYGLPESQTGIFLLVATLPVLLDVLFKYLIFRHLNRSSPATVATYHAIIE